MYVCFRGRKNALFLNSLPNDKILDWSKLKAFADDKIKVAEMRSSLSDRKENLLGKKENSGFQHFLLFPQCFQKPSFQGCLQSGLCGKELNERTFPLSKAEKTNPMMIQAKQPSEIDTVKLKTLSRLAPYAKTATFWGCKDRDQTAKNVFILLNRSPHSLIGEVIRPLQQ